MIFLPDYSVPAFSEPVGIGDVLAARDLRAELQLRLIREEKLPLVSFTMNLPGEYKRSPGSDLLFLQGLELLEASAGVPVRREFLQDKTGLQALCAYDADAVELKKRCRDIEESFPAARLFDLDVIDTEGKKLQSALPRKCLVCGNPARECARSRAHGLDAVKNAVNKLLEAWLPERLSQLAAEALRAEALLSPKPGLVDSRSSGAHGDMDINLMLKSAESLRDYFRLCAEAGLGFAKSCGRDYAVLMAGLKALGIKAEERMLETTGGVNTHRGAIYLMGLLSAALAIRSADREEGDAFTVASRLAASVENLMPGSHGEAARRLCPRSGPRFEAVSGFPLVRTGYDALAGALQRDYTPNDAMLEALLRLMLLCDDSNIIYRGGMEGLEFTRSIAREILALPPTERRAALERADAEMTARRLSPGGAADLLSASIFVLSAMPLI